MSKKSIDQKRKDRELQEDLALRKVLYTFLVGLVAELYLLLVYRGYGNSTVDSLLAWNTVLHVGIYVGIAALVLGTVAAILLRKKNKKQAKILSAVAGAGLFFVVTGLVSVNFFSGSRGTIALLVAVPVFTLLGLVYFLFQRECFVSTLLLAASIFAVWVCNVGLASSLALAVKIGGILSAVILLAVAALVYVIRKGGGKLGKITVFASGCRYSMLFLSCGVGAAAILAAILAPAIGYYLLWALGICIFAELVYFTTKLM